ncbi:DNA polymerase III subunit beta [Marinilactibacillus psychrotolerans]|uniref:Beta sliding clamp n=2 Tax=Marinilactibacillus psychrotolerans TaxID=191770 RepID=A0A511H177_9LACT|nr:DNA polymerase III subunit beta [Marinilactibacillus psychrotolerans]TLQ07290.1 DNA polymerase III subunit beta [Marinilactibacillus psychrotolerans]SDC50919.1 DNA polymerase-3 subunit beta [Marinilactibacillus psychrotolerans]SJN32040.1 DNA polymerase III beta subunit [Marinilactibacillus psychrotolerans 42ea]GEL66529.1 DNA polymerase III subunit beta [Marinilactibacillus psychrotolerans]GEQ33528.1 DNA polymerase III subunit beta [Marinilactibacillus psychrotolerans]
MKFTVNRIAFLKKLKDVQLAVSSRTTIPILTGIKLVADSEGIKLTGSNSDISIETLISVQDEKATLRIEEEGSIVLQPARFFSDIVNKLPDETFSVEVMDRVQTAIKSSSSSFLINGLDAANYPHLPEIDTDQAFTLPVQLLKTIVKQTVIAVSSHESRPILTGVNLSLKEGKLKAVATDSHRLSQRVIPLESAGDFSYNIVIPGKSLQELSRLLDDSLEEITVAIAENQILFKTEDTHFYSRLLEGNYPDTDRLIPENSSTQITLDAQVLLGAVERASLLSHEGKNNVVKLSVSKNELEITGNSPEVGRVNENVSFTNIDGEEMEISFNPDYLKAALNTFGPVEITLKLISTLRPFVLVPSDDNREFIQLITPIRTS